MKKDILIKARTVSKEWQIKQCEDIIKDTAASILVTLTEISLIGDDLSEPFSDEARLGVVSTLERKQSNTMLRLTLMEAHNHLYKLLKEIDSQEALRLGLNQELLKLNNADGYCYCESCVINRARG